MVPAFDRVVGLLATFVLLTAIDANAADAPDAKKPDFKLTPEALAREFEKDAKAATARYKGKVLELEGIVWNASKIVSFSGDGIDLSSRAKGDKGTDGIYLINCKIVPAQLEKAWWLERGQKVKVTGVLSAIGKVSLGLTECQFTELEKSPLLKFTAEQLTSDFIMDEKAAEKKCSDTGGSGKYIVVEGVVADRTTEKGPGGLELHMVKFKGKGPYVVSCRFKKDDWEKVKKGDSLIVKGTFSKYDKAGKAVQLYLAFPLTKD
jgi:hypothetical protein